MITVGLVKYGRKAPVSEYIVSPMSADIGTFLETRVGITRKYGQCINQDDYTDIRMFCGCQRLVVYVNYESVSLVADLVSMCLFNGVHLTLMMWNDVAEDYIPHEIY